MLRWGEESIQHWNLAQTAQAGGPSLAQPASPSTTAMAVGTPLVTAAAIPTLLSLTLSAATKRQSMDKAVTSDGLHQILLLGLVTDLSPLVIGVSQICFQNILRHLPL